LPSSARLNQQYQLSNSGTYTNSTHVLVKTRIPPTHRFGVVAITASYEGDRNAKEIGFSVAVYSGRSVQVAWDEAASPPLYLTRVCAHIFTRYPDLLLNPKFGTIIGRRNTDC
jgi:calpain-7